MYSIVETEGVEAAIEWFREKGKRAAWGGSLQALAEKLIEDGRDEEGLRLMAFDLELTPDKVWLVRKTAEVYLAQGRLEEALALAERGLELKPDDERLEALKDEVRGELAKDR